MNIQFFLRLVCLCCLVQFISCSSPQSSSQEQVSEEQEVGEKVKTILFFGNSLTAGYGIDPEFSFA
ncbi:MAG: hypothetical protein ACK5B5_01930, partial [Bacteroidota bacterium]